jgi:hypothetical protein
MRIAREYRSRRNAPERASCRCAAAAQAKVAAMNEDQAADFVRRFTEFWKAPVVDQLDEILAPNARLLAPMAPTTVGREAGKRAFANLFEAIEGMTAEVHRWGPTSDGVLIELTVHGIVRGSPVSWPAVDRFVLDESGLASERFTYFDPLPLILALGVRPQAWPAFARMRLKAMRA